MENQGERSIELHRKHKGKIRMEGTLPCNTPEDLSYLYTPGVAAVCKEIQDNPESKKDLVINGHCVAVITDGSAVLGLGNIGPDASLPVMEGKSYLIKKFAGVDSFPIAINTQDVDEFVKTVINIAPTFSAINLEDISAPRCFEIENKLKAALNMPIMHDDQHGTAIVTTAALINSAKVLKKELKSLSIVISGAGAAGSAILHLLHHAGIKDIIISDKSGVIKLECSTLAEHKKALAICSSKTDANTLKEALVGRDVFIGVSAPNLLTKEDIKTMANDSIVFALANPVPEIYPDEAMAGGASIVATGRSDFNNQINNVLVFPGIFKGALENNVTEITNDLKLRAAIALASCVDSPTKERVLPGVFDMDIASVIAKAMIED